MNILKIIQEEFLNEITSDNTYQYEEISNSKYKIITEKETEYILNIIEQSSGIMFNYTANGSFDTIVNEGNMYKILRTIFTIIKEYTDKNTWVKFIAYLPVKKSNENIKDNIRHKLYLRFLKQFYNFSDKDIKIRKAAYGDDHYVFVYIKK